MGFLALWASPRASSRSEKPTTSCGASSAWPNDSTCSTLVRRMSRDGGIDRALTLILHTEQQTSKLYHPVPHPPPRPPAHTTTDPMPLDDTTHKIYIHDLDSELASTEPEAERLVFLPDIEKKLSRIPQAVLLGEAHPDPGAAAGGAVVLYRVPASLSVPEERDQVRRAIIESRARARERLVRGAGAVGRGDGDGDGREEEGKWKWKGEGESGAAADQVAGVGEDEDAMDMDLG